MKNIALFAGTSEGRELAWYLEEKKIDARIAVATSYGAQFLKELSVCRVFSGRMEEAQMEDFLKKEGIGLAVDATHPYARLVSANLRAACAVCGIAYLRLERERTDPEAYLPSGRIFYADTIRDAVALLNMAEGNVFASTGGKEASVYLGLKNYRSRLYIRLLPDEKKEKELADAGLSTGHVLTGRGLFSQEENERQFRAAGAEWLVTKESGKRGGLPEKLLAAAACGMNAVIINRPFEEGVTLEQARRKMDQFLEGGPFL